MKFQANINDTVQIVLTATGAEIYNNVWKYSHRAEKKEGDILRAQLWSLFQDFGEQMYIGMPEVPFKECKISFV